MCITSNVINNAQVFNIQQESSGNIVQQQPINNNIGINNFSQTSSQVINNTVKNENLKMNFIEYFTFILGVILKPYTSFKDKLNNFNEFKNSAILSIIVSISAMLISLVKTIISTVCVTTGGLLSESKTEWIWENLKEIQFVKVIGMNLLAFLGIILAIACVYYIAGLVIKKQPNFSRLLGIAAVSVVPILLSTLIFLPILTMIYIPLGMGVTIFGAVYTLIIMYETINSEIPMEGNAKYYFNLICLSILFIVGYFVYMKFFMVSTGDLSDYFDMFR